MQHHVDPEARAATDLQKRVLLLFSVRHPFPTDIPTPVLSTHTKGTDPPAGFVSRLASQGIHKINGILDAFHHLTSSASTACCPRYERDPLASPDGWTMAAVRRRRRARSTSVGRSLLPLHQPGVPGKQGSLRFLRGVVPPMRKLIPIGQLIGSSPRGNPRIAVAAGMEDAQMASDGT